MCGACPGGARLSPVTQYLGVRGELPAFTRAVAEAAAPRARVTRFGDGWTVAGPTGGSAVVSSVEDLVRSALGPLPVGEPGEPAVPGVPGVPGLLERVRTGVRESAPEDPGFRALIAELRAELRPPATPQAGEERAEP